MKYKVGIVISIIIIIFLVLNFGLIENVRKCLGFHLPDGVLVGCTLSGWKQYTMANLIYLSILLSYIIPAYFGVKLFLYLTTKLTRSKK